MRPRFSLSVIALAMSLAIAVGTAVFGCLAASVAPSVAWTNPERAIASMLGQVLSVVALGSAAGAVGWLLFFLSRRDGWHRMEWIAFLPFNYGGRNPFDTGDWSNSR